MAWGDLVDPNDTDPQDDPKERQGLTIQFYNSVRALLNPELDEDALTDEQIADDTYFGAAKRYVDERLGSYLSAIIADTDKFRRYQTAVALMTASYLCLAVQQPDSEGISVIRRGWHPTQPDAKKNQLEIRAEAEIDSLIPQPFGVKVGFQIMRGRRGSF